jgi:ribosomal protein S18 acetylase RimI-like enzyme
VHDIYVDEGVRHKGVGASLIDASLGVAREFGASKLMLSVAVQNSAAHNFFESSGFKTTMHEMMRIVAD